MLAPRTLTNDNAALMCGIVWLCAGASAPVVENPEDIDLDEGDAEEEEADAGADIQLETKPVPVRLFR